MSILSSLFDSPLSLLKLATGGYLWLVAGQETAEDADAATEEQEADGQQQQGLTGDELGDLGDFAHDSGTNGTQVGDQRCHSVTLHMNLPPGIFVTGSAPDNVKNMKNTVKDCQGQEGSQDRTAGDSCPILTDHGHEEVHHFGQGFEHITYPQST